MMSIRFPVYQPTLMDLEKRYVNECLDSGWISSKGQFVNRFERDFSAFTGAAYSLTSSNGTTALHLAMLALGIGPGDEVVVPTLTYVASVNAIEYVGARPVFVDCDPKTWQLDTSDLRRVLTQKTRAIMVVHLYGVPAPLTAIMEIANEHGLLVIEDCAESLGTIYFGQHVGLFGDIATFSFYGNKTITTGEGGMVATNNPNLSERVLHLRSQGIARSREYWHDIIGYNYRMTNICAAIGCAQLSRIKETLQRKAEIAARYRKNLDGSVQFQATPEGCSSSNWMVSVLVQSPNLRDGVRSQMLKHGIETRPVFYPVHTMPMYSKHYRRMPHSNDVGCRGITVPSYPALTDDEVDYISQCLLDSLRV